MPGELFDSDFMQKLEFLTLMARKLFRGRYRGEHRTYKKGSSLEFHDYRAYQPGDDFRYIDWSIFSRLDRLFVKLFAAEEDLTIHILVDTSTSMRFGEPSKLDYAKKVGAALAYIGLVNLDRVRATAFTDTPGISLDPTRRSGVSLLFRFFEQLEPEGRTSFAKALTEYSRATKRPGLAIVLSDLLDPDGYEAGLRALRYAGYDIMLLQILAEEEITPPDHGSLRLIDSESGEETRVTVDKRIREAYNRRLDAFFEHIERFSLTHGIEYVRASTIVPFEDLVLKYLRQGMYLH